MNKRVVVTGLGAVTPLGNDVKTTWENMKNGVCGIDTVTKFDASEYKCTLAGEVRDFDPSCTCRKGRSAKRTFTPSMRLRRQRRHTKTAA